MGLLSLLCSWTRGSVFCTKSYTHIPLRHMAEPQSAASLGWPCWPRCSYTHEPGTTVVDGKLGSTFSAGRLPIDDVG